VIGEEVGDDARAGGLLGDEQAVVAAVDVHARAGGAAGGDADLAEPGVRQAIVHERPVVARHVEHQLLDAVKFRVAIVFVEVDVELHLLFRAVVHHCLHPRRLPVQLEHGVGDGLAAHVEDDRVLDDEVVAVDGQRREVVEFGLDAGPFLGRDVDRVRAQRIRIEEIRAGVRTGRSRRSRGLP
jgi:hypothetical protein